MACYPVEIGRGFNGMPGRDGRLVDITPIITPLPGLNGRTGRSVPGVNGSDGLPANSYDGKQDGLQGLQGLQGRQGLQGKTGTAKVIASDKVVLRSATIIDPLVNMTIQESGLYSYSSSFIADGATTYTLNKNGIPICISQYQPSNIPPLIDSVAFGNGYLVPESSSITLLSNLITVNLNVLHSGDIWAITTTSISQMFNCTIVNFSGLLTISGETVPFSYRLVVPGLDPMLVTTTTPTTLVLTKASAPGAIINLNPQTRFSPVPDNVILLTATGVPVIGQISFDRPVYEALPLPDGINTEFWFIYKGQFVATIVPITGTPSYSLDRKTVTMAGATNGFSYTTQIITSTQPAPSPNNYQHLIAGLDHFAAGDVLSLTYSAPVQPNNAYQNLLVAMVSQ